jgi:hypothetical protein
MAKMMQKMAQFGAAVWWWAKLVLLVLAMIFVWRVMPDGGRHEVMGDE